MKERAVKKKGYLYKLLRYLMPHRRLVIIALLMLLIAKGLEAYVPLYMGQLIDELQKGKTFEIEELLIRGGICFLLLTCIFALEMATLIVKNWVAQRGLCRLRCDIYSAIQQLPLPFLNKQRVGSLITRTIHDVDQVNQLFSESILPLMGSIFLFLSILTFMLLYDMRIALIICILFPLALWLTAHFRHHQSRCYAKIRKIVSSMNSCVQEHLMGAMTIRSLGLEEEEKKEFDNLNEEHRSANIETIHYFAEFFAGIDFLQSLALIGAFLILGLYATGDSGFDVGTFFTFSLYILMLFRPLSDLAERYNLMQSSVAAGERIFELLEERQELLNEPAVALEQIESIEFRDVWFGYNEGDWVLKGLSFTLKRGESAALVGMTGAGKTTIFNLLLRFYPVQKGQLLINGESIDSYSLSSLRSHFSLVLQEPELFNGTIGENIAFGRANCSEEELAQAVHLAHLEPTLQRLSKGLEHEIGHRGERLSAGERQLLSLARAAVQQRDFLLLDEATANIDSHTEAKIQQAMHSLLSSRSALIIAHRLSTIRDVARILVLDKGSIVEEGSHKQLLARRGIYEKLYRLMEGKELRL